MRVFCAVCAFAVVFSMSALPLVFADHEININTASLVKLDDLPHVGSAIAQLIIDGRPYSSIEEISQVKGIGDPGSETYEDIIGHIVIEASNQSSASSSEESIPTPSEDEGSDAESDPSPPASSSSGSSGTPRPVGELSVEAGDDQIVVVGADVQFTAPAYRGYGEARTVRYTWNFGDGSTSRDASPTHRFGHSGRYIVVVSVSSGGDEAMDRFVVTAEEVSLIVRTLLDGSIEVENISTREIDLSQWTISFAGLNFVFPENSHMLGEQTIRIPSDTLGFLAGDSTKLAYPNGTVALHAITPLQESEPERRYVASRNVSSGATTASSPESKDTGIEEEQEDGIPQAGVTSPQVAAAASDSWKWWFAMFGLIGLAVGGIIIARRFGRREWDIIEEKPEEE